MTTQNRYCNLTEFLIKSLINRDDKKNLNITNTRIGDNNSKIFGGSYHISYESYGTFLELYYNSVFVNKNSEYLTEKQIVDNNLDIEGTNNEIINGPILLDFDFRYEENTREKQYNKEHIFDIVSLYLEELKNFYIFDKNTAFSVYVMEKNEVKILDGVVKDGIHMIIGIQMNHIMQQILRKNILEKINDVDIPIINEWENVIDCGITKGVVNWQLYGSKKPHNDPYMLTLFYNVSYDENDGNFEIIEKKAKDFDLKKNLIKLSARNTNNVKFPINPNIINIFQQMKNNSVKKVKNTNLRQKVKIITENYDEEDNDETKEIKLEDIINEETLSKAIEIIFKSLNTNEYYLKELHKYVQILPEKYYEPGSHLLNRQVAFALKNTDERLFLSWVSLRSKASDFDYCDIPNLYKLWKQHFNKNKSSLTKKSILYWAKNDAFEDYEIIKKQTIDYYVEITLNTPTEYDFAMVLYQLFKDKYVCASIVHSKWYIYNGHKWEVDNGNKLRLSISREMYDLYEKKLNECTENRIKCTDESEIELLKKRYIRIFDIASKLKKTSDKNNILREAMELFYDGMFKKNLDSNKNLLGFNNGVIDFKNKIFRNGEPQDYLSKSTNVDYIPNYLDPIYEETTKEINVFMEQLFPIPDLNRYMWEHLSSCLIGENRNQTFNIYKGVGSNGKSMLSDLMTQTLGDYKGVVPLTLITEKRTSVGGTSSEVMQLKGIRYAVMQEPSKEMKINEGIMKEIVGGDPLQGRSLYSESETFEPQFTLAVCTNVDFTINSNDDGTWRRIRRVPFLSKFVDNPDDFDKDDENNKYIFPRDRGLKEKFNKWVNIFASLLVNKAFETQGIVKDCDIVLEESNNYRKCQDYVSAFIDETIYATKSKNDCVKRRELLEQFKFWFSGNSMLKLLPSGNDITEQMDRRFGKSKNYVWYYCKINYGGNAINPNEENDEDLQDYKKAFMY